MGPEAYAAESGALRVARDAVFVGVTVGFNRLFFSFYQLDSMALTSFLFYRVLYAVFFSAWMSKIIIFRYVQPGAFRESIPQHGSAEVTALCTEVDGKKLTCPDADYAFQFEAYFHSSRGRVCAVDPSTGESWVVADGFSGANGIAVSLDEQYLYLSETMEYSVWRIPADLRNGTKGNGAELFLSNLPGCTDNLNRGQDGRYWVGLVSPRDPSWDQMLGGTFMRKLLLHVSKPARNVYPEKGIAAAFAFDDSGAVVDFLMARDTPYNHVTGVTETDGRLYLHANNETGRIAYIEKL